MPKEKLNIDKFYRPFTFVERIEWITPTQCLISAKNSPLVLLHFPFGVFAQGALGLVKVRNSFISYDSYKG